MANLSPRAWEEHSEVAPSVWTGHIRQDDESFPTTVFMWERDEGLLEGEIYFTTPEGLCELTFAGRIVDENTLVWITDRKTGDVTYPGLYVSKLDGHRIVGTWQVPSANQCDQFYLERSNEESAGSD
jgi:hypothetical protein